jgi:hypothetical protein
MKFIRGRERENPPEETFRYSVLAIQRGAAAASVAPDVNRFIVFVFVRAEAVWVRVARQRPILGNNGRFPYRRRQAAIR